MSDFHLVTAAGVTTSLLGSPCADAFAGTVYTDVVCMKKYETCYFLVIWGAIGGATTHTITIEACDDFDATTTSAIAFDYKRCSAVETNTAWTAVASTGLTTTSLADQTYIIRVKAENLPEVSAAVYENVRLKSVEVDDNTVIGSVIIMMADPRYNEATLDAVTA